MGLFKSIKRAVSKTFDFVGDLVGDVIGWLVPEPEIPDFGQDFSDENNRGALVNKFNANAHIPVVYGTRKVGGNVVFLETSGTDNQYLYMALVLSEGEVADIDAIFVNDNQVTWSGDIADNTQITVGSGDANFYSGSSLITCEPHFGSDSQTASSLLSTLSSWTSNHRLRGLCYLALRFEWNQDKFGSLPTVQAVVKGKKVYNPNLDSTVTGGSGSHRADTSSTWEYSDNPILQLLDYLRNDRFGMGIANSYFDSNFADWQTATDVCDANITPYSGASQIDLMDSHAVVDTSKKAIDNVKNFIRGARAYLNFSGGIYNVLVETTGSASITLTEDNIIGGISVKSKNKNSRYNRVIVNFTNPDKNYQSDTAQFPPVDETGLASADQHATMKTADGGLLLEGRFDFTMLTSPYQAQEMAEIILRRSRSSLDISLIADATALDLAVGDIVNITHATPSFSAKPFRVQGLNVNSNYTVTMQCSEHQDSFYTFGTQQEVASIPNTTLPNPFVIQPPASVTLSDQLIEYNDGTVIVALDVTVGASPDNFIDFYQVEYKLSTDSDFIIYAQGSGLNHRVLNVIDQQTYDVRVKAVNSAGVSSTYVSAQRQIVGAIAPPSDVTDFSCNVSGQEAHLSWEAVSDLDLAYYNLRFSEETDGTADWQNSVALVEKISRPATSISVPVRQGTYLIKAVDKLGNFSSNATAIISNVTSAINFNNITTQAEHPTFGGTFTDTILIDNAIELDSTELFDSASGNFDDDTDRFFDQGASNFDFVSSGNYEFANVIDIGAKHTVRITASMTQTSDNPDDLFDGRTGNFDDASSNFDGDTPANCNAHLEIATSDDNTTFTDFRGFVIGEYEARYLKFRVVLISRDNASTPVVSAVSVTVDMQDRIFSGNDIVSGTSTKSITFTKPFKTVNYAVGVTAQGMATGDYFTVSNKAITGFDVAFFNSSNAGVSKTFDFIAKGF
jgi:predicted phage tail protein